MNARPLASLAFVPLLAMLAAATACSRRHDACGDTSTTSAELAVPIWTAVPQPVAAPAPAPTREPTAAPAPPEERPLVKIDDAPRPEWVPDAATLTVVEAPDLRRNLGIVAGDAAPLADAAPP